jgi:hypothetical protein
MFISYKANMHGRVTAAKAKKEDIGMLSLVECASTVQV